MVNWNAIGTETGRFTVGEDGQIFWQANKTNPLPGHLVAVLSKGESPLAPSVVLSGCPADQSETARTTIIVWLNSHIRDVLAPLFALIDQEGEGKLDAAALEIGQKLHDAMGVIHRSDLEGIIPSLTPDHRTALRRKRVKLGPILVFMPDLVKPAAVNMRALLYGLWRDKPLPMSRPADGRVSVTIDPSDIDRTYFRSIGYPVFGSKAIRIDMLDRVITDIYDSSKDWQFQAKHQYMEWLGCGEEDLYAILESMGFRRQKADEQKADSSLTESDTTVVAEETVVPVTPIIPQGDLFAAAQMPAAEEKSVANTVAVKPALATFWLKKGKMSDRPKPKAKPHAPRAQAKEDDKNRNDKPHHHKPKPHKDMKKKAEPMAKNYSAKPKDDEIDNDSPFAILKQLKK